MKKKMHAILATSAAMLLCGGTCLAGDFVDVEQVDPYSTGNWQAQTTGQLDVVDLEQDPDVWNRFTAQQTQPLASQRRIVRGIPEPLCGSRLIGMLLKIRFVELELDCP